MTTEDQYILRTQGEEELKRLQGAIEAAQRALASSVATNGAAAAATRQQASALAALETRYNAAAMAVTKLDIATNNLSRRSAKFQLGLGAANIAQDVIQGGNPAYAINNILGMAGNSAIRGLAGEFVAAAGGAAGLGAALATVGVTAGAAFLAIDAGLKSAKLGWSDLDNVIGNMGPINAFREAFGGVVELVSGTVMADAVQGVWDNLKGSVNTLADYTLGWNGATEAARAHRTEVEQTSKLLKDNEAAQKRLAGIQSDAQKDQADKGKLIGQALANLGGAGGINAVADKLAGAASAAGGDEDVTIGGVTKKRSEWAKIRIQKELAAASQGDAAALGRLKPLLQAQGLDTTELDFATKGRNLSAEEKKRADEDYEDRRQAAEMDRKAAQEESDFEFDYLNERAVESGREATKARKEREAREKGLAGNLQGDFNQQAIRGNQLGESQVADRLMRSQGLSKEEADRYAAGVTDQLRKGFDDTLKRGAGQRGTSTEEELGRLRANDTREQMAARLGIADAQLGVLGAQASLKEKMFGGAPERFDATNFAAIAESKGSSVEKDMLERATASLAVQRAQFELQQRLVTAAEKGQVARFG